MTYPVTLHIGSAEIHLHFLFEILAYTFGFRYYLWLRKSAIDPISTSHRMWIFIAAAFGGFLGAHILGIFEKPLPVHFFQQKYLAESFVFFMQNKTVLGGFLGGLFAVEGVKKYLGIKASSGDLMTFSIMLGLIIGRVGCHLEGLEDGTFGNPTTLLWGIDFGDNVRRHPTNLYEIIFLVTLWLSIVYIEKISTLTMGMRFKIFLIGYLFFRFFIEFLKPVYVHKSGLSSIQIAALLGIFYYGALYFLKRLKHFENDEISSK